MDNLSTKYSIRNLNSLPNDLYNNLKDFESSVSSLHSDQSNLKKLLSDENTAQFSEKLKRIYNCSMNVAKSANKTYRLSEPPLHNAYVTISLLQDIRRQVHEAKLIIHPTIMQNYLSYQEMKPLGANAFRQYKLVESNMEHVRQLIVEANSLLEQQQRDARIYVDDESDCGSRSHSQPLSICQHQQNSRQTTPIPNKYSKYTPTRSANKSSAVSVTSATPTHHVWNESQTVNLLLEAIDARFSAVNQTIEMLAQEIRELESSGAVSLASESPDQRSRHQTSHEGDPEGGENNKQLDLDTAIERETALFGSEAGVRGCVSGDQEEQDLEQCIEDGYVVVASPSKAEISRQLEIDSNLSAVVTQLQRHNIDSYQRRTAAHRRRWDQVKVSLCGEQYSDSLKPDHLPDTAGSQQDSREEKDGGRPVYSFDMFEQLLALEEIQLTPGHTAGRTVFATGVTTEVKINRVGRDAVVVNLPGKWKSHWDRIQQASTVHGGLRGGVGQGALVRTPNKSTDQSSQQVALLTPPRTTESLEQATSTPVKSPVVVRSSKIVVNVNGGPSGDWKHIAPAITQIYEHEKVRKTEEEIEEEVQKSHKNASPMPSTLEAIKAFYSPNTAAPAASSLGGFNLLTAKTKKSSREDDSEPFALLAGSEVPGTLFSMATSRQRHSDGLDDSAASGTAAEVPVTRYKTNSRSGSIVDAGVLADATNVSATFGGRGEQEQEEEGMRRKKSSSLTSSFDGEAEKVSSVAAEKTVECAVPYAEPVTVEEITAAVTEIYTTHNPDKISEIPTLLVKYKGRETEMLQKIRQKYKIIVPAVGSVKGAGAALTSQSLFAGGTTTPITTSAAKDQQVLGVLRSPDSTSSPRMGGARSNSVFDLSSMGKGSSVGASTTPSNTFGGIGLSTSLFSKPVTTPSPFGNNSPIASGFATPSGLLTPGSGFATPSTFLQQNLQMSPQTAQKHVSAAVAEATARVTAIYTHFNPSKLGDIPKTMQKYRGQEKKLIADLEKKYNVPAGFGSAESGNVMFANTNTGGAGSVSTGSPFGQPSQQQASSGFLSTASGSGLLSGLSTSPAVNAFGTPSGMSSMGSMANTGLSSFFNKPPSSPKSQHPSTADVLARVTAIYQQYNPSKLGDIPNVMNKYLGNEMQLIANLEKKYNVPPGFGASAAGSSPGNVFGGSNAMANPGTGLGTSLFNRTPTAGTASPFGQQPSTQLGTPGSSLFRSGAGNATSPFGQQQSTIFGKPSGGTQSPFANQNQASSSPFGNPQQQSSPLSSLFSHSNAASAGTQSPFLKHTGPSTTGSSFLGGGIASAGMGITMGGNINMGGTSLFGNNNANTAGGGFGGASSIGNSSLFGQQQQATPFVGQQAQSSPFGQQQQMQQATPFGQQNQMQQSSPFGQQQQQTSSFGQMQQSSPFGQPQQHGVSSNQLNDVLARVTAIYQQYNPSKLGDIPNVMNKYLGNEMQLIANLEKKYNVNANNGGNMMGVSGQPQQTSLFGQQPSSGFGQAQPQQTNAFGQPQQHSLFGQQQPQMGGGALSMLNRSGTTGIGGTQSPFNRSATGGLLGGASSGATTPFGSYPTLGGGMQQQQQRVGGFGQASGFGQSSSIGQTGGFGQTSGFAQTSSIGQTGGFGQSSGFGQTSSIGQTGGFGQSSGFGQTSSIGQTGGFGQSSGFGQTSSWGAR